MARDKDAVNQEYDRHPFLISVDDVVGLLDSNIETGLSDAKVQELQQKYGLNRLSGEGGAKWYALLAKQISNAMILVGFFFLSIPTSLSNLTSVGPRPCHGSLLWCL